MNSIKPEALIIPASEGKVWQVLGQKITCKVSSDDSNGAYTVIEQVVPPQSGPPLHIHYSEDEIIYVLEGECEIECEGQSYKVLNGATAAFPKNSRHTFRNMGTIPCKVLVTIIPGGFEGFFEEVSRLPTNQPPDIEQIKAIANKYNAEILTPQ